MKFGTHSLRNLLLLGLLGYGSSRCQVSYVNVPADGTYVTSIENFAEGTEYVLNSFQVPNGEQVAIDTFQWDHQWIDAPPDTVGTGMEITILGDDGTGAPDVTNVIVAASYSSGYFEVPADPSEPRIKRSTAVFSPALPALPAGPYWFQAQVIGPAFNSWFAFSGAPTECWISHSYYDPPLRPCSNVTNGGSNNLNVNFILRGTDFGCSEPTITSAYEGGSGNSDSDTSGAGHALEVSFWSANVGMLAVLVGTLL